MTLEDQIRKIADEQGWNDQSLLALALDFIVNEAKDKTYAFVGFLLQKQAEENAGDEDEDGEDL